MFDSQIYFILILFGLVRSTEHEINHPRYSRNSHSSGKVHGSRTASSSGKRSKHKHGRATNKVSAPYPTSNSNLKVHRNYHLNTDNFDAYSSVDNNEFNEQDFELRKFLNQTFHVTDMNRRSRPSMGIENVIFTNLSEQAILPNYERRLRDSKVFKITANYDFMVYVNFFSTTEWFHPKLIVFETRDLTTFIRLNTNQEYGPWSSEYGLLKDHTYIFEVGTNIDLYTGGFRNIKHGGFILLLSSKLLALSKLLKSEEIHIKVGNYSGLVVYTERALLKLKSSMCKEINFGELRYEITPFYNPQKRSVSLYYIYGSNEGRGRTHRESIVELVAVQDSVSQEDVAGVETNDGKFQFTVKSRILFEITSIISYYS